MEGGERKSGGQDMINAFSGVFMESDEERSLI